MEQQIPNNKMVNRNPNISIITVSVNGLNTTQKLKDRYCEIIGNHYKKN